MESFKKVTSINRAIMSLQLLRSSILNNSINFFQETMEEEMELDLIADKDVHINQEALLPTTDSLPIPIPVSIYLVAPTSDNTISLPIPCASSIVSCASSIV